MASFLRDLSFLMPGTGRSETREGTKIFCNIFIGYINFLTHFNGARKYFV